MAERLGRRVEKVVGLEGLDDVLVVLLDEARVGGEDFVEDLGRLLVHQYLLVLLAADQLEELLAEGAHLVRVDAPDVRVVEEGLAEGDDRAVERLEEEELEAEVDVLGLLVVLEVLDRFD